MSLEGALVLASSRPTAVRLCLRHIRTLGVWLISCPVIREIDMKKITDILLKIGVAVFLLYVAYGYLTSSSKHIRTIIKIDYQSDKVIITVDDKQNYLLDLNATPYNKNNMLLLYEGKKVWVLKEKGKKYRITPVKQDSMPLLTREKYLKLISAGFTDSDIRYSYVIPDGFKNPNKEKRTYGETISYGAPSLLVEKISERN